MCPYLITVCENPKHLILEKWLISKGRKEEGLAILSKYHANGHTDDPLVQYEFQEIEAALNLEKSCSEVSFMDFTKTHANRHRLLILVAVGVGTNWVGNGIVNYYLSPTLHQIGIYSSAKISGINAGLQIWNLIISCCSALLVERLGRRFLWLFSNCGMLFSYIFTMALSGEYATHHKSSVGIAVIPFLFLFFGAYDVAWTPLQFAYPVEILPFSLRMKGMVIFIMVQNVAVTVNTFVNPIAMDAIGWKYYGIYIAILAGFIVVIYFYFPETRYLTIEEISEVFENGLPVKGAVNIRSLPNRDNNVSKEGDSNGESSHIEIA
ncbi:sugar transporter [Penicillium cataractarum]|uniref:Sugar transporter n=1 Tax=Penicillium cataractarum TaxID=2100454 RepID=A0A9W9SKH2_9EURO|nr:sugar transporter [Penicillium cataractarum]KAJ5379862.1 sugar transporter [Penicillium cataractarum]